MNHIYKTIFNKQTGTVVVVSEKTSNNCQSRQEKSTQPKASQERSSTEAAPQFLKTHLTLAMGILLSSFFGQFSYAASDNIKYKNYDSNNTINGCTVVNIQYESTYIKDSNGNNVLRYPTGTPNSQREGNSTGRFDVFSDSGKTCDIEDLLNPTLTQGDSKYTQQRDHYSYGHIDIKEGVLNKNEVIEKDITAETTADNTYLVLMSDRPSTASFKIETESTADIKRNFMVINTLGGHGLQNIGGTLNVNGNLVTDARSGRDTTYPNYNPRSLYANQAVIKVTGDFSSYMRDDPQRTISGGSNADIISTNISVGGNTYFYTNSGKSGVRMNTNSVFDIQNDLVMFNERLKNITAKGDTNSYGAAAFSNADSILNVGGNTSISTEGFHGYIQSGMTSLFKTNNLEINTTLLDETTEQQNKKDDQALQISGGKIIAGKSKLLSNNNTLTVNSISALSLGENATDINLDTLNALVKLGKDSSITSLSSNGIVIADYIASKIDIQNGTSITAATDKSIILDGIGEASVNIYEGAELSGNITLGGGNDTVNLNGTVDLNKIPKLDGGEDNTNSDFNTIYFKASQYEALDTSKFTNFQDFKLEENSNISLLSSGNNIFNASILSGHGIFINNGSSLKTQGSFLLNSNLTNSGTFDISKGKNLLSSNVIIANDYIGKNGVLIINTELNDDNSKTDKLIITGNATGSTEVEINNVNGSGAQTVNGIHVIQTGSSESNQTFYLDGGAITVGAFDYLLHLKKQEISTDGTFDNWYLESKLTPPSPITPPTDIPVYTPDVGEYLAAETMGNTLFTSRLEDREGASQYQNLGDNDTGNVWVRAYGGHHQFKSLQDQLKTKGNSFVTQIGTGLVTLGEEDQYNLGVMGGFATYDGKTRSNLTDRESKTKINGYSLGLYGTWYAHPVEKRGAYIDSWVLWNKFKNKIDTVDQNQYKYDSSGITASIEAGGDYLLNKNSKKDWWIQPQAQLIYQGVHADHFQDAQGVDINHGKDNLQARLGVKTYLNIPTDSSKLTSYRPYVALNFIHNTNPYSVEINDIRYENEGSANLGELKLGVEGNVTKNSQVWLNASYVAGSHSNQAYQGNIGWKYNF